MMDDEDKGLLLQRYPASTTIFKEGEESERAYFIKEGRVRIHRDGKDLGIAGAGDILGEMSMLKGQPHTATADALEKTTLVIITKDMLEEKIEHADPLIQAMINGLIKRLYNAQS